MSVLESLGKLADGQQRERAAKALAEELGAEDLILFVRDPELDILLPAPGFRQTLRPGTTWRAFVDAAFKEGRYTGFLPDVNDGGELVAHGYGLWDGSVLVLLGGTVAADNLELVLPVVPLLSAAVGGERAALIGAANARLIAAEREKARLLADSLSRSRLRLTEELQRATETSDLLERQALELEEQAAEAEATSEQLVLYQSELESANRDLSEANRALSEKSTEADRARTEAEAANRAKSNFLAMMSHELRTPLNAIGGFASLLQMGIVGPVTPRQEAYLDRIKRSQDHLAKLINDILNFAKVEAGKVEYRLSPTLLDNELAELGHLMEPQAEAREVNYAFRPGTTGTMVLGDRDKIAQIVLNLLSNAIKFTPVGGSVLLHTDLTGLVAYARVTDSGPGIAAEDLASIFEPFVQLKSGFTAEAAGVGLGLAISRELARGMGGDLNVESVVGRGSTFSLSLPLANRHADED